MACNNQYAGKKEITLITDHEKPVSEMGTSRINDKLMFIIYNFTDYYPGLIELNVASKSTFEAIDNFSLLFKRNRELGQFLKIYRGLGFYIFLEMKKDNNSKFDCEISKLKISLNKQQIEYTVQNSMAIQTSQFYQDIVLKTNYKVMQDCNLGLEIAKDDAKSFMDDHIMSLENGINKANIIWTIRKNIQENVHTYLWIDILSCSILRNFIIEGILDLSHNDIQIIPDNFVNIIAHKIDLRSNNLQQVPEEFKDMACVILDYRQECMHLSQELQDERERFRTTNPINMITVQNYSSYPISLETTHREDVGDVSRLVGYSYGNENLSNSSIMNIIIKMHADGYDIHCNTEINRRLYRSYDPSDDHMTELVMERLINPDLSRDFSRYFYIGV